jgi:hypothetical protein
MRHHGDEYYQSAKAARSAADLLPAILRNAKIAHLEPSASSLAEVNKILGRRRVQKRAADYGPLFKCAD